MPNKPGAKSTNYFERNRNTAETKLFYPLLEVIDFD